jgi:hypothetical protein
LIQRFFEALDFGRWVTLDSHSRQGSLVMDFNRNLARDYQYTEQFDFVENSGTSEHVFDQRAVFENIHNLCKVGGVMLHRCPMMGVSNIMLYHLTPTFFHAIALANRYEILDVRIGNRWGDTVEARQPQKPVSSDEEFRAAVPMIPGYARGVGKAGRRADWKWPAWGVPKSLRLPEFLELGDVLRKTPMSNMAFPLARVCNALAARAKRFRPQCPGELYTMMLFRKTSDEPFQVPYQSNCVKDIEPIEFRERYRNQFEALGLPISADQSRREAA